MARAEVTTPPGTSYLCVVTTRLFAERISLNVSLTWAFVPVGMKCVGLGFGLSCAGAGGQALK